MSSVHEIHLLPLDCGHICKKRKFFKRIMIFIPINLNKFNQIFFSCVVGRGCLLWPGCSLGKTLLAFALLYSVLQEFALLYSVPQICLLLQVFLVFQSSIIKGHLLWVLVLKGILGLHRTVQVQLLQHYWSGHRLGLLWYWMVCLGNKQRSF